MSAPSDEFLAAMAERPSWRDETRPLPLRCSAPNCGELATGYATAFDRAFCAPHSRCLSVFGRRVVPLILCTRCRRQGPIGLSLAFEGEDVRRLCRGCAEIVRRQVDRP
jgi:hypothetical protein